MTRLLTAAGVRVLVLALASLVAACASGGASTGGSTGDVRSPSYDREQISRAELETRGSTNMFDVVSTMRSNWLVSTTSSIGRASASGPAVYMDGRRIGEAAELRSVTASAVESARYLSAAKAQSKYGLSEARPVIELIGRGGKP